jgi:alpha-L-arabinofuranosidase
MNVATGNSTGKVGFANSGYWGIDVKVQTYTGSFYVKGSYTGAFTVSLQSNLTNEVFASTQVSSHCSPSQWVQHEFTLTPGKAAPNVNNTFNVTFESSVSFSYL